MSTLIERVCTVVVAGAACVVAAGVGYREFGKPTSSLDDRILSSKQASRLLDVGRLIGDADAKVKVTVFSDMECPFCAAFHKTALGVTRLRPKEAALVFVHYPIATHRDARRAAVAAECAAKQYAFDKFVEHVFENQPAIFDREKRSDSTFLAEATAAGVLDTSAFTACLADPSIGRGVDVFVALGEELGFTGTPTIVVDGRVIRGALSEQELIRTVKRSLRRSTPAGFLSWLPQWVLAPLR